MFSPSNIQLFNVLYGSWHCRDEEWYEVFCCFFLFHQTPLAKKLLYVHLALTVLQSSERMVAMCSVQIKPKKPAIIFLEVLRERTTLVWSSSLSNTQTVDCCLLSGSCEYIQVSSPVTSIRILDVNDRIFFSISDTNQHELFFALRSNFPQTSKCSCKIDCIEVCDMSRDVSICL